MEITETKVAIFCITVIAAGLLAGTFVAGTGTENTIGIISTCIAAIAGLAGYDAGYKVASTDIKLRQRPQEPDEEK